MPDLIRIGYLTSVYGRAADTFIRSEVTALRSFGHEVHTFSIRRPGAKELVSDEIRREQANTEAVFDVGLMRWAISAFGMAVRSPKRMLDALRLTFRIRRPGLKGHVYPIIYFLEAAYLGGRLRVKGVEHLHNHIGENSAAVAMIASAMTGIPYSLMIHGPSEFDRPTELALDLKIGRPLSWRRSPNSRGASSFAGPTSPIGRKSTSSIAASSPCSWTGNSTSLRSRLSWPAWADSPNRKDRSS